ncbi:MAG: hypothetical protein HY608_09955 [Planctomycetes bacterium]|nr:hypothetical protein [Planctomycetota bacterium]
MDGSFLDAGTVSELRLGVTALAALAAAGEARERALVYIAAHQGADGFISDLRHGRKWGGWEHAYATFAMAGSPGTRDPFERAVRWILSAQNADGSWTYCPEDPRLVQSALHCSMMEALLLARRRGMDIPDTALARATAFLKMQELDGGFRNQSASASHEPTAVAIAALQAAGEHPSLDYLQRELPANFLANLPETAGGGQSGGYPRGLRLYGMLWTSIAYCRSGDREWSAAWQVEIADGLLEHQNPDGSWQGWFGPEYGTAMAVLTLTCEEGHSNVFTE